MPTLTLGFTGLCLFYPGRDRMTVLLPDATKKRIALDDEPLTRHDAVLTRDAPPWTGMPQGISLRGKRLVIEGDPVPNAEPRRICRDQHILNAPDLMGDYRVDEDLLGDKPNTTDLGTQIRLIGGTIPPVDDRELWDWVSDEPLSGRPRWPAAKRLTWLIFWTATLPEGATRLALEPLSGDGPTEYVDLNPGSTELYVANVCGSTYQPGAKFDDFRWYFELLSESEKGRLKKDLKSAGRKLPVLYTTHGMASGLPFALLAPMAPTTHTCVPCMYC